ncbi:MAG: signal recognition particle-docking protein FtsY [Oscillospiraceae bacterium]|nr:signal recognition particle-docking protein FtsY [Oscillospiraceae bacterium]MBP1571204.1 signal recognition particle-docking protein FtsY [Oscillospiraceae bacterium]
MGLFEKLGFGLKKTKEGIFNSITKSIISSPLTDELYDDLLEQLILADVGYEVSEYLCEQLRTEARKRKAKTGEDVVKIFQDIVVDLLSTDKEFDLSGDPAVILIIGVNGVGKTTSIGKLANYYSKQGKKVLLAAGDTFRAAAASQLNQWAERSSVDIVMHDEGADPSSVIFDAVQKGKSEKYDIVICDTAGRLHNKKNLMAELGKISRVIRKASETASVETLLVLEAITGQNAIFQAKEFISAAEATGIILTKLDGTAKGGSVISIKKKLGIPVRFVGVGEGVDDLLLFDAQSFAETLFSLEDGE